MLHSLKFYLLHLLILIPVLALGQKKSEKRGVSQNGFSYSEEVKALEPGVSWYYNWATSLNNTELPFFTAETEIAFYPMCWNGNFDESVLMNYFELHPNVKYLLGFNEPNFKAQANMTPAEAASIWPQLEKIAEKYDLELVAPALNYSPDAPYTNPVDWYDEFFEIYPDAKVDYLALHCYMITSDAMMSFINNISDRYGKKIWLTEFCAWDNLSKDPEIARQTQKDEMLRKVEAMELSEKVAKYSWFKARGADSYPYYSLMRYKNDSQGILPGTLTELGKIYVNMSSFDTNFYYTIDGKIPATNYIKSAYISVEENSDLESDNVLQVSNFSSGRSLEYLIDIPKEGEYEVMFRMISIHEPFSPVIDVYSDDVKLKTFIPEPSITENDWKNHIIKLNLPKGKQRIIFKSKKSTYLKLNWFSLDTNIVSSVNEIKDISLITKTNDFIFFNKPISECHLYSLDGKIEKSVFNSNEFSIKDLKHGFYMLKIKFPDGRIYTEKLLH